MSLKRIFAGILILLIYATKAYPSGVDIFLVVDTSESIIWYQQEALLKDTMLEFINLLESEDRLGIVTFGAKERLHSPLVTVETDETKRQLTWHVKQIRFKGRYTNIPAGLEKALYEIRKYADPARGKAVVLLSDGRLTHVKGLSSREELLFLLKNTVVPAYKKEGIPIFSISFPNSETSLLEEISLSTDGNFFLIKNKGEMIGGVTSIYTTLINRRMGEWANGRIGESARDEGRGTRSEVGSQEEVIGNRLSVIGKNGNGEMVNGRWSMVDGEKRVDAKPKSEIKGSELRTTNSELPRRWFERLIFISFLFVMFLTTFFVYMNRRKRKADKDIGIYPMKPEVMVPPQIDQAQVEAAVRTVINEERIRRMEEKLERIETQGMKYLNKTLSEAKFISQESIREMLKTGVHGVKENLDKVRIDMESWEDGLKKFQKINI